MERKINKILLTFLILVVAGLCPSRALYAQLAMTNISGRKTTSLNGEWKVIVDPTGVGDWRQLWTEKKPMKKQTSSNILLMPGLF
ncbi:MAG: hypothetical protein ABIO55_04620 [Ginsengibacter sp.]